jgi:hypothetical protein
MRAKISIPGSAGSRISARVNGAGHAAAGNIPAIIFWLNSIALSGLRAARTTIER